MARKFTSEERKFLRCEGFPELTLYGRFVENNTGAELIFQGLGLPLKLNGAGDAWEVCLSGDEASATAFGVEFEQYCVEAAAGSRSQRKLTAIQHGPIVVSVEGLPTNDPTGTAYNAAALEAALAALPVSAVRIDDNRANLMAETGF